MDENRIIKIEELEVGDEILCPSNGSLRYFKILRKPTKNPKTGRWRAVHCSTNISEQTRSYTGYQGQLQTYKVTTYRCTPEEHNTKKSVDLSYKDLWLVRRER